MLVKFETKEGSILKIGNNSYFVRVLCITCHCGKENRIYVNSMDSFTLPNGMNVWKYVIKDNKVSLFGRGANSINFHGGDPVNHKPECHYTIQDADYVEDYS